MRVADQQIYGTLLGNLQRSRSQILTAQEQISSQKKVAAPSDDPNAFGQINFAVRTTAANRKTICGLTGRIFNED